MRFIWYVINGFQLVLIAVGSVICSLIAMLGGLIHHKFALWVARALWSPYMCAVIGVRLKFSGRENIPRNQPYIFTANHQSFIDIPVLFIATARPLYFVAKKELLKMPFIGQAIWVARMIFIDRSNHQQAMASMKRAGQMILGGKDVITFPEGTRSKEGSVGVFRRGTFIIALSEDISIVPVGIKGAKEVWPGRTFRFRPGRIEITFGTPFRPSDIGVSNPEELAEYTRKKVVELLS